MSLFVASWLSNVEKVACEGRHDFQETGKDFLCVVGEEKYKCGDGE